MDGFDFAAEIRVRFAETDAQGIAHHTSYLVWFEVARVEFLEHVAGGYPRLRELGLESVVLESHARFLAPAVFDDRLLVHARCLDVRAARFRFEYAVERDGVVIADGWTMHATVDAETFRPARTPDWLRAAIGSKGATGADGARRPRPAQQ
jgi:acyl-CoA thioester hydrolase